MTNYIDLDGKRIEINPTKESALKLASQKRSAEKIKETKQVIQYMYKQGIPLKVKDIAIRAGVSTSFIYNNLTIKNFLEKYRMAAEKANKAKALGKDDEVGEDVPSRKVFNNLTEANEYIANMEERRLKEHNIRIREARKRLKYLREATATFNTEADYLEEDNEWLRGVIKRMEAQYGKTGSTEVSPDSKK